MKKIINWQLDTGVAGASLSGQVEVNEGATDAEIEEAVKQDMWSRISLSWGGGRPGNRHLFWRFGRSEKAA
ncbi:MAG: hypothetical protein J0H44_15130 [Alphaproteobacteria bacterium]|nr:hypothetical protein [Alphaproteobacteria bacterium]